MIFARITGDEWAAYIAIFLVLFGINYAYAHWRAFRLQAFAVQPEHAAEFLGSSPQLVTAEDAMAILRAHPRHADMGERLTEMVRELRNRHPDSVLVVRMENL